MLFLARTTLQKHACTGRCLHVFLASQILPAIVTCSALAPERWSGMNFMIHWWRRNVNNTLKFEAVAFYKERKVSLFSVSGIKVEKNINMRWNNYLILIEKC